MKENTSFDVIIIGGSYAGLSAAMALGRSLRHVLVLDSGEPCNRQTPHSHNFITQDGEPPGKIAAKARYQVLQYETVTFRNDLVVDVSKTEKGYEVKTRNGDAFPGRKLLFATGLADQLPAIPGFSDCWGISVLHCPYCHGYEVRHQPTGILGNGDLAFDLCRLISNWTSTLTLFTNGKPTLTPQQITKMRSRGIEVIETPIAAFEHEGGKIHHVLLKDGEKKAVTALFARPTFRQHCSLPENLGCELTPEGLLQVDVFHRTSLPGIYAAGDNTSLMRAVSAAVAAGTKAGAAINKALVEEEF